MKCNLPIGQLLCCVKGAVAYFKYLTCHQYMRNRDSPVENESGGGTVAFGQSQGRLF
jgi:hypothetical protein